MKNERQNPLDLWSPYVSAVKGGVGDGPVGPVGVPRPPAMENDDYAGDDTTTGLLTIGGDAVSGILETDTDVDWFAIDLEAGVAVFVAFSNPSVSWRVYDASSQQVGFDVADFDFINDSEGVLITPPTSGRYYVSIEAGAGIEPGASYTLTASEVLDDYSAGPDTTGTLAIDGTATGSIEFDGDVDWFALEVTEGQRIIISSDLTYPAGLDVVDADGNVLVMGDRAGDTYLVDYTAAITGTVYVAVSAVNSGTDYQISAALSNDDYAADTSTGGMIAPGGTAMGVLENPADSDWFAIDLSGDQVIIIESDARAGAAYLSLYDEFGNLVEDANGPMMEIPTFYSGRYYIGVSQPGLDPDPLPYTLSASGAPDDYSADSSTTALLEIGGTISGKNETQTDVDWVAIDLTAGERILITSNVSFGQLDLVDEFGNIVQAGFRLGVSGATFEIDITPETSGRFFLQVSGVNDGLNEDWTLSAQTLVDDFTADINTTGVIEVGGTVSGTLEVITDEDWIAVDMVAGEAVSFFTGNPSLFFQLFDENGNEITPLSDNYSSFDYRDAVFSTETSGRYYLAVSSGPNQGPYTIGAARIDDEISDTIADAPDLLPGEVIVGTIGADGDADIFRIEIDGDGPLVFETGIAGVGLTLTDADGNVWAGAGANGQPTVLTANVPNGTYYLRVDSLFGTGTEGRYILSYGTPNDDFPNSQDTTGAFTIGEAVTGRSDFEGDADWFAVELEAGQGYEFSGNVGFGLFTENGFDLLFAQGIFGASPLSIAVEESGTYYLSVVGQTGQDYTFTSRLIDDDFSADTSTVGALTVGGETVTSSVDYIGDRDWFAFEASAGEMIGFSAGGSFVFIDVYDADGNLASGTSLYNQSFRAQADGTYYVSIRSSGNFFPGDEMTIRAFQSDDDYTGDVFTQGVLNLASTSVSGRTHYSFDEDWFRVEADAPGLFSFSSNFGAEGFFELFDENGELLGGSDGNGAVEIPQAGTYFVGFRSDRVDQNYTISWSELQDDFSAGPVGAGTLAIGGSTNGTFTVDADVDAFAVQINAGDRIEFSIEAQAGVSTVTDTILLLVDAAGNVVAEDDDGGPGDFSLISYRALATGTYYLIAGVYEGDSGGYTVSAQQVVGPTNLADTLRGTEGADTISGLGGDDDLFGDGAFALSGDRFEAQLFRAYQAVFDRAPDEGGFNAFLTSMQLGQNTQESIIAEFVTSAEFVATYGELTNRAFMEQLYRNVLDRDGDAQGVDAFTAALDGGRSRASVVVEFANSLEFVQLMTLPSAAFASNITALPEELEVYRAYQAVFGREPDAGGFSAFSNALIAGVATLESIVAEFVASAEFQATYGTLTNAEFVELLYTNVLPGNTDAQGRANFTALLDNGVARAVVVAEFVQSFEFRQLTNDSGQAFVASIFDLTADDILEGGAGNDTYYGGRGDDTFIVGEDNDLILDFQVGSDVIDLSALGSDFDTFDEIIAVATQIGQNVVFDFGGGNSLTLQSVILSELTEADFGLGGGSAQIQAAFDPDMIA